MGKYLKPPNCPDIGKLKFLLDNYEATIIKHKAAKAIVDCEHGKPDDEKKLAIVCVVVNEAFDAAFWCETPRDFLRTRESLDNRQKDYLLMEWVIVERLIKD